ncbi:hypothetical protein Clacol_002289 [Clathrus columnatus]|uniref:Uncharacterized protein n=1 Tax=Clathrus columnatus TaxID=1419009 RepID=A0AAV5A3R3_9AGAM|nr:hypothetical protein Clacol_002289 [Clathrus columnatus]
MTDHLKFTNLADQYDEQVSANLLITNRSSRKALRLLVPQLAKMFIDDILIGRALSGTLYYNSSKDLEGDNNHYLVLEVPKDDKYRVYVFFFKHPPMPYVPSDPPTRPLGNTPMPLPYATLHHFRGEGKWTEFNWGSSVTKITNASRSREIDISLPAVHITGKIHADPHLHHIHPFAVQGIMYHQDYQSLVTTERALYSPDSIVFYTKDGVESDQIAFFVPSAGFTLPNGHDWFTGIEWESQAE